MAKIIQDRNNCIGCGACASVCSKHWKMEDDGKATLIGGKESGEKYEKEVEEIGCNKDAKESCPVHVISIEE